MRPFRYSDQTSAFNTFTMRATCTIHFPYLIALMIFGVTAQFWSSGDKNTNPQQTQQRQPHYCFIGQYIRGTIKRDGADCTALEDRSVATYRD
jgi:hypothetical protein